MEFTPPKTKTDLGLFGLDRIAFFKTTYLRHLCWLLPLLAFVAIYLTGAMRYAENDDIVMLLIASGAYTGAPDMHMVFTNAIYGWVLSGLYGLTNNVEWYTIGIVAMNMVATTVILHVTTKHASGGLLKFAISCFILAFFAYATFLLQFTKTAALMALAGLCLIERSNKPSWGVAMFAIAALVRFEAAFLILAISLPLAFPTNWSLRQLIGDRKLRHLAFAVFICIACNWANQAVYSSNASWHEYAKFNKTRGKINDNPNATMQNLSNSVEGVIDEDIELLLRATSNPVAIGLEEVSEIFGTLDPIPIAEKTKHLQELLEYKTWLLLGALLTVVMIFNTNGSTRRKIISFLLLFIGLMCFIALNGTAKDRVFYPAFFAMVIFCFVLIVGYKNQLSRIVVSVIILVMAGSLSNKWLHHIKYSGHGQQVVQDQQELIEAYFKNGNKLINFGASYRIQHFEPFMVSSSYPTNNMLLAGWLTHIPFHKRKFDSFECFGNGYGLLLNNRLYDQNVVILIEASIRQNHGQDVTPFVVEELNDLSIVEFQVDGHNRWARSDPG